MGRKVLDELIAIERRFWANDPDFYQATYRADAILIFPEIGRLSRSAAVEAIRDENRNGRHWAEVSFEDVALLTLATDAVLITYRAEARWNYEANSSAVFCAT